VTTRKEAELSFCYSRLGESCSLGREYKVSHLLTHANQEHKQHNTQLISIQLKHQTVIENMIQKPENMQYY